MAGILLASVEGLGHSPFITTPGEIWEWLQEEKEEISRNLLIEGSLCWGDVGGLLESEASEEYAREIQWRHRGELERRLRDINNAQDRLTDGVYGRCTDCSDEIDSKRLTADPAASLCIKCQRSVGSEHTLHERYRTVSSH